jgi:uncharacterized protein YggE
MKTTFDLSNRIYWLIVGLSAVVALGILVGVWTISNIDTSYDQISVEGDSTIKMEPDVAYLSLAISTENEDSAVAVEENNTDTNAVLDAIFALGVAEEDVQTHSYSLYPSYDWVDGEYEETGYEAYQGLTITVYNFDLLGDLISGASEAGANQFNGVSFELENYEEELEAAREEAIEEARAKADTIADASGAKLGKLMSYYEYTDDYDYYGKGGMVYAEAAYDMEEARETVANIQPGQEEVTLTVSLSFRLK